VSSLDTIPSLIDESDVADAIRERTMIDTRCAMPAIVKSFSRKGRPHCSIQIAHEAILADDSSVEIPIVERVPVVYPQMAGITIQADLEPGDEVLAIATDRQLDIWLQQGGTVRPLVGRFHSIADIVVMPGLVSDANVAPVTPGSRTLYLGDASDSTASIRIDVRDDGKITAEAGGIDLGSGASLGAARVSDPTSVSANPADPWQVWFQAVASFTGTTLLLTTALDSPISTITTGSTKTRIE
jgi:hypothetical protein